MKMTVFWDVAPYSLVKVYRRLPLAVFMMIIVLMMEAGSTSETSVNFYQTTLRNIPEDSHPALFVNAYKHGHSRAPWSNWSQPGLSRTNFRNVVVFITSKRWRKSKK
jgi:hypothetical protein